MTRKAQLKRAKRIKMATRMRDFYLLCYWLTGSRKYIAGARDHAERLLVLEEGE